MRIHALFVGATAVVLLGDYLAARLTRRLGVSYSWYIPGSIALYLALGIAVDRLLGPAHAFTVGAAVGFIDGSAGSLIAYRVGAVHATPPTYRWLLVGAVLGAVLCGALTRLGVALAGLAGAGAG